MRPHELSELIRVDTATLRRWAREKYSEFLSPEAQGGNALQRSFTDHDARVLAWIASMRERGIAPPVIIDTLKSSQADNWRDLPPLPGAAAQDNVVLVPMSTVEAQISALVKDRDDLRERLTRAESLNANLQSLNADLQRELADINKRLMSLLEAERRRRK